MMMIMVISQVASESILVVRRMPSIMYARVAWGTWGASDMRASFTSRILRFSLLFHCTLPTIRTTLPLQTSIVLSISYLIKLQSTHQVCTRSCLFEGSFSWLSWRYYIYRDPCGINMYLTPTFSSQNEDTQQKEQASRMPRTSWITKSPASLRSQRTTLLMFGRPRTLLKNTSLFRSSANNALSFEN